MEHYQALKPPWRRDYDAYDFEYRAATMTSRRDGAVHLALFAISL